MVVAKFRVESKDPIGVSNPGLGDLLNLLRCCHHDDSLGLGELLAELVIDAADELNIAVTGLVGIAAELFGTLSERTVGLAADALEVVLCRFLWGEVTVSNAETKNKIFLGAEGFAFGGCLSIIRHVV